MNDQHNLKIIVRGAYDIQKLRIQMGNRIVGNFKAKLGQKPGESEDNIDAEGKQILKDLRTAYKKLTDGVKSFPRHATFEGDEVISTYTELCLLAQYVSLETSEADHFRRLGHILRDYPIFTEFLNGVKGVGPAMAGVMISEIDIHRARHPSSLWKYAGLDVAGDGFGRSRKKEHLVTVEYKNREGKQAERQSITFNPFLKTKLIGVLGPSFIKQKDSPYRDVYDGYKHRLQNHAKWGEHNDEVKDDNGRKVTSKGRRHNMAVRYTIKIFLIDLYSHWRALEGLPVSKPYGEAKLGITHAA